MASPADRKRIVVGVDGSEGSLAALRWAIEEARLRGDTLVVVHAWTYPYLGDLGLVEAYRPDAFEWTAKEVVADALEAVGPELGDVRVETEIVQAPTPEALCQAGRDADLIVLGSRGRGGFAGLLLGSVSQQVAHHATSPVVIVPPPR